MVRWQLWRLASLLALCLIFITNGIFVWCAIGWVAVESWVYMRPGRRTIEQILGPWEKAKIVAAGPFASVGLAALAKIMGGYFAKDLWHQLMIMNIWFAIFSVLPLMVGKVIWSTWWSKFFTSKKKYKGTLHVMLRNILQRAGAYKPIGEHLFFGGRVLWIFMFVFVVVSCLLFLIMSILASVLIAASLAVILMAVWHFKLEPQKYRKW